MYYFCVVNFITTCWNDDISQSIKHLQEIIHFSSMLFRVNDLDKIEKISEFDKYVKPLVNPALSDYCIENTNITQEIVDNSKDFREIYNEHHTWLTNFVKYKDIVYIVTKDKIQMKNILYNETIMKNCKFYNIYRKNISLQDEISNIKSFNFESKNNLDICDNLSNLFIEIIKSKDLTINII